MTTNVGLDRDSLDMMLTSLDDFVALFYRLRSPIDSWPASPIGTRRRQSYLQEKL